MHTKSNPRGVKLTFASLIMGLVMVAGFGRAEAKEWRIATLAPDGSSWMKILSRGAQEVTKATAGRLTFKYFTSGVQGDEKEVVRKIKGGGLDGGAMTSVGLALIDESIRVLELPMVFENIEEMDYVRKKMWPTFQKRFAKKGFILGHPGDVGFVYFYSNNPVRSASDLSKAKVWLWGEDAIVRVMFKKLGINGVPMGVPEVLPNLNTGRINACYGSPLAVNALQWASKVKYSTSMPMSYGIGATVIKKSVWDAMSPEDQKTVNKVMKKQAHMLRKTVRKDNRRAHRAIIAGGVKVIETPAAMVAEFDKHAKSVWTEMAGKMYSKADLDLVLKYRDEFRAKNKK
jgi:TRAP-type C4-dicarboxylate transport system substrate-binding protein